MTLADALKRYRIQLLLTIILFACLYSYIFPNMIAQWYKDDNYSHGFLVPFISLYFLYQKRNELFNEGVNPWGPGLFIVILAQLQLIIGWLGGENFTMRSSMISLLAGLTLYFFGRRVFRKTLLPLAYLLFMVPLPYIIYDSVAFPLKLFVTKISVLFLKTIGVVVWREGNILMFPAITLEVADACSGMRSLMSLLALGVAYAFICKKSALNRFIIIISTIPIAIFTNSLRVVVTGILAQRWGSKAAEGFFHEFAGIAVFAVAMAIMIVLGISLREDKYNPKL